MDQSKSVTVITATLNRQSLEEACRSLDEQTYRNWHHVVLGDGMLPTDYASEKRSTLGFSTALGEQEPGANMRNGTPNPLLRWALKHLHLNDYFCFLDDDNQYVPTYLEKMVAALNSHPEVGIVLCGAEDFRYFQRIDGYPELARCDNSAFMARREVAQSIVFPYASLDENVVQDYEFIKLCADRYGWTRLPERLLRFGTGMNPPPDRGQVLFLESWKLAQMANDLAYEGRFEQAEATYKEALSVYSRDAWSWKRLAELYLIQGDRIKADEAFRRWRELYECVDKDHYAAQYAFAIYQKHYGQDYRALMERSVQTRVTLENMEPNAYEHTYYVLLSYLFLEDWEMAQEYLNKCRKIRPKDILWAYSDAGWTLQAYHSDFVGDISAYCAYFGVMV